MDCHIASISMKDRLTCLRAQSTEKPHRPITISDFNGDGNPDLVIGNCCGLAVTSVVFGKRKRHFCSGADHASGRVSESDCRG
jgi:hypothetical protein